MVFLGRNAGLIPVFPSPTGPSEVEDVVTEEAAVCPPIGPALHVTPLVNEGQLVPKGAPVACLRHIPDVCFTAPITGRVARISLLPGRKLSEIALFREDDDAVEQHAVDKVDSIAELRRLMQKSGIWPWLRRRPFGGMPSHDETPAAIFVMAADTLPFAIDPMQALAGREDDFWRGLEALARLAKGPVFVCRQKGAVLDVPGKLGERIQFVTVGPRHPSASPGFCIHQNFPAGLDAPVWDIHAEDTAALGALLANGILPMTRLVNIAGAALREARTVRTHVGADLRQLTHRIVRPGPYRLVSGSPLGGHTARWLSQRHRQITVLPRDTETQRPHWFFAALTRSASPKPVIPSAALTQSLGATLPAVPFVRALGAGDDGAAINLGLLSLLEEDLALVDYVLSEPGQLAMQLRVILDRIQTELTA